jgi:hypothetical protein
MVGLGGFVQPKKPDNPYKPNNDLLRLVDLFRIQLGLTGSQQTPGLLHSA